MSDSSRVARAFGQLLSEAREEAGLTQEALAYLSGIHRTQISHLELGRSSPRLDTLIKIAGALGIEPCALVTSIRWQPPNSEPREGGFRET